MVRKAIIESRENLLKLNYQEIMYLLEKQIKC